MENISDEEALLHQPLTGLPNILKFLSYFAH